MKQMNALYQYAILGGMANIGENAGMWVLDQIFWIGIIIYILLLIYLYSKKAHVSMAISCVVGAVLLFLIKNPTLAVGLGGAILKAIGLA